MRRCAWVIETVAAITMSSSAIITTIMMARKEPASPETKYFQAWISAPGRAEMMLTVMMMEVPLPIPFSVIWSPIHISSTVPATMVVTVRIIHNTEGSGTRSPKRSIPAM